jgi:hypothetical protein
MGITWKSIGRIAGGVGAAIGSAVAAGKAKEQFASEASEFWAKHTGQTPIPGVDVTGWQDASDALSACLCFCPPCTVFRRGCS